MRRIAGTRILVTAAATAAVLHCGRAGDGKSVTIPIAGSDYTLQVISGPKDDAQQVTRTQVRILQFALSKPGRDATADLRTDGFIHVTGLDRPRLDALLAEIDRAGTADKRITAEELKLYTRR